MRVLLLFLVDTEYDTWNVDPVALANAFKLYTQAKVIIIDNLYGTPGKMDEIRAISNKHVAVIIEDIAEPFGATYKINKLAFSVI